jgi:glycolate oxidase
MISAVDAREGTRVPPPAGAAHPLVASAAGRRPSPRAIARARRSLVDALGAAQVIDDPERLLPYGADASLLGSTPPDLVVRARSTADVVETFRVAALDDLPVTPRGLGSGKCGGAMPVSGGIVLSLDAMTAVREVSRADLLAVAEPGVVTERFMDVVEAEGLFYPPDPNSLAISTLGGNVATNAGGPRALKYGVTRGYVLGLEVVLPTGEVMRVGRRTQKGVTGYDLVGLFVGSEGTLGVITEITTRLIARPAAVETALVTFADAEAATRAVAEVFLAGLVPRTLELLDRHALDALRAKTPGRFPEHAGAILILETDGPDPDRAMADLSRAADVCTAHGATDVVVALDAAQRARIWEPRRTLSWTLTATAERKISEDIVVPRSQIPAYLARTSARADAAKIRVATYGHAGDGNLHVNVLFAEAERARAEALVAELMADAVALGGTISGEHGIGLSKRPFLSLEQSPEVIELQRRMKALFDPRGILNPGKIFPARGPRE